MHIYVWNYEYNYVYIHAFNNELFTLTLTSPNCRTALIWIIWLWVVTLIASYKCLDSFANMTCLRLYTMHAYKHHTFMLTYIIICSMHNIHTCVVHTLYIPVHAFILYVYIGLHKYTYTCIPRAYMNTCIHICINTYNVHTYFHTYMHI